MKYTVDTKAKTIQIHDEKVSIHDLEALIAGIVPEEGYKILIKADDIKADVLPEQNPFASPFWMADRNNPFVGGGTAPGTILGDTIINSISDNADGIKVQKINFPGGFAVKITTKEEEE